MDATPTGKAQAAQPESLVKSILSPCSVSTALAKKVCTCVGFPLVSLLFLDSFPGLPVSLTVPLVSTDGTNEESCCLLGAFLMRISSSSGHWSRDDALLLPLPPLPLPLRFCIRSSRELGNLRFPQLHSFGSLPSCDHTRHTRNSCLQTSWTCLLVFPLATFLASLGPWESRRHPWWSLLTRASMLERNFRSSVSVSQGVSGRSLHSKVITEDLRTDLLDAQHVHRFPEVLHIIAKSLANHAQLLLELSMLATTSE